MFNPSMLKLSLSTPTTTRMASQGQFQIIKITAHCDYPVRNSAGHLLFGSNILWDKDSATDEKEGVHCPQVFLHDFDLPVSSNSSIQVIVKPVDNGFVGGEYCLHGKVDNVDVLESKFVSINSVEPITIPVTVVKPEQSPNPFSWRGLFTWGMRSKSTEGDDLNQVSPETYLEFYWVSKNIHEVFLAGHAGIPISLLRECLPSLTNDSVMKVQDVPRNTMQYAVSVAYGSYSKVYDTYGGAPHFGVGPSGGTFQYTYYIQARAGGSQGSLQPIVNCYDQGAMLQTLGTVSTTSRPSWLFMRPFGYINQTNLVGVGQCNNPFFNFNHTNPVVGINDNSRTGFDNHVFNGVKPTFDPNIDSIYDACTLLGLFVELTPQDYINQAIDHNTTLTAVATGNIMNISQQPGVVAITSRFHEKLRLVKVVEDLIKRSSNHKNPEFKSISQIHWDNVGEWIKSVIGGKVELAFHEVRFADGAVEALWHFICVDYAGEKDDNLVFRVRTHTRVGSDGRLDIPASSDVSLDDVRFTLKNTQIDLGNDDEVLNALWEPSPLLEHGQVSLQHKAGAPQGRILVVSGNCLIDVSGASSSASLARVVHKVLSYTTVDKPFSVDIPKVIRCHMDLPPVREGRDNIVKGIGTSFVVSCTLSGFISAATADTKDHGLLLETETVEHDRPQGTSTVKFTFKTRTLGLHDVVLKFAGESVMTFANHKIQVEVVKC